MTSVCNIANIVGLGRAAQRVLTAQLNGVSLLYSNTNYFAESEEAGGFFHSQGARTEVCPCPVGVLYCVAPNDDPCNSR